MKTIGLITFHFVNNYGGVLQAYALQRVLEKRGDEVHVIDYRNWFIKLTDAIRVFPIAKNPAVIKSGIASLKQRKIRIRKINQFIREKMNLTNKFNSTSLYKSAPEYDYYICGSDQIWNPFLTGGVTAVYFLDFVKENRKKIAYAPSMGTNRIPNAFMNKMLKYIDGIDYLSVRERTTAAFLSERINRNIEIMIDPTLLLSKDEWRKIEKKIEGLPEKYILLYMMQGDDNIYRYARLMKEKYNLPIVEISRYGFNPGIANQIYVDVGIEEFLGLFDGATCICTNSYHGFVYSLVFGKEVCLIPSKHFSSRINNLCEMLNISDGKMSTESSLLVDYDKEEVEKIIKQKRENAFAYFEKALS